MFKDGGRVGSGCTIIKGATGYVTVAFDGSIRQIIIDIEETRDICPHKINDVHRWLIDILSLMITHVLPIIPRAIRA